MTTPEAITVEPLDGPAAARSESAIRLVYAEVFAEAPYEEGLEAVEATFRRFRSQARKSTFRAALARTAGGEPVGIAYGYPLSAATGWWDHLVIPASADLRREDGQRTFGLMEFAVRRRWRRHGVGQRLHEALLAGGNEERVLLNALPEAEAAQSAYRSWGYRKVGEARPWEGAALHDVMLLQIR
ncbi:GNAT family N-acetyltransferase [Streptomyces angustmyceticus]|uniref:N-acetyltransferase domain-containing protein n=1 Tax=Streptomyces angustmyceticus TaxID=285578 RepID=A0A5J4LLP9_9ACTN|nr:GNAT family N-acetyltransferase [Streptomyces angustmyceticus]UAL67471.1 GNAT family N-acetyltransferase [Streptomyces angustmyceticus]GES31215.1 hypothetical protein San01_37020 [Streptomyces angustmyceticus]